MFYFSQKCDLFFFFCGILVELFYLQFLGKVTSIDQGFSLSLALLGRADALMAVGDYEFALEDLKVAMGDENLSIKIR